MSEPATNTLNKVGDPAFTTNQLSRCRLWRLQDEDGTAATILVSSLGIRTKSVENIENQT